MNGEGEKERMSPELEAITRELILELNYNREDPVLIRDAIELITKEKASVIGALRNITSSIIREKLYASKVITPKHKYPEEYKSRSVSIAEQIDRLLSYPEIDALNLNATWAMRKAQSWYDSLHLPDWVEGPIVYIWWEKFGSYSAAHDFFLDIFGRKKDFKYYIEGIKKGTLQQNPTTAEFERKIKNLQPGDFLVLPSQAGEKYAGVSSQRGRILFERSKEGNEIGLGMVAELCRALSYPERVQFGALNTICVGDEYCHKDKTEFNEVPRFYSQEGTVILGTFLMSGCSESQGISSAFIPAL